MSNLSIRYVLSTAVFAVLLGACTLPGSVPVGKTADIIILSYDLQEYVPVPVAGETPVRAITTRSDMDIAVSWMDVDYNPLDGNYTFLGNTVYMSQITLTAKDGFAFAARSFKYFPADAVDIQPRDELDTKKRALSTIVYKQTTDSKKINDWELDLTGRIPAPVVGADPLPGFFTGTYGGTITWETGGNEVAGKFQVGMVYTAKVILYAAGGSNLTGSVFTHARGTMNASDDWVNTGSTITGIRIDFPAAADMGGTLPNVLDLTAGVPKPVSGGTAVTYFYANQYTGTVMWSPDDGVFRNGRIYTAAIVLRPVPGYSFAELETGFTHSGNLYEGVPAGDGSVVVTITFPVVTTAQAVVVDDRDLSNKVPSPVAKAKPETYFSAGQYSGSVEWTATLTGIEVRGLFMAGMSYTAKISLIAEPGYKLDGVGTDAFTYDPLRANFVSYNAASNVATIIFAATGADAGTGTGAVPVTDRNLTSRVGAPVSGGTPDTAFTAVQYKGTVTWAVTAGPAHSGAFWAGTGYTATVTLTAEAPYTFEGTGVFYYNGSVSISSEAGIGGTRVVTIRFPVTDASGLYTGPFSGLAGSPDSAIDLIRAEKGMAGLTLDLSIGEETVDLSTSTDLGRGGLVLTSDSSPLAVTINGNRRTVQLAAGSNNGSLITVKSGVTLTLRNITLAGKANNDSPLVAVQTGGTLVLEEGAVITGNNNTNGAANAAGGGIAVTSGGILLMKGGTITGNSAATEGGGVYIKSGGRVEMTGGKINGNETGNGGGGAALSGGASSFEMSGDAEISGNTTAGNGGGVYIAGGSFAMSGKAAISGNTGTGTGSFAGGVYVAGSLAMTGSAMISGNEAKRGGGVYADKGTVTMKGSAEVSGNTAGNGAGGVLVGNGGALVITETAKIRGNTTVGYGGGIGAQTAGMVTINGSAAISGNTAAYGGGVEVSDAGEFFMAGGTLSGNTASTAGGGIAVTSGGILMMNGGTIWGLQEGAPKANKASQGAAVYKTDDAVSNVETTNDTVGDDTVGDDPGEDDPGGDNPGGDNPGGDNPGGDNPGGDTQPFQGDFSGPAGGTGSVISKIKAAAGQTRLELELMAKGEETVRLSTSTDLGGSGLVLDSSTSPANLVINGDGRVVRMAADSGSGSLITVKSGVTLTLRNITLAGKADNTTSLISVNGGHLILETGVVITGNNANTNGGGIAVTDGGILVMNGNAVISNNTARYGGGVYGGGVYVSDNGSLVMNENAVIRNNTALYGGGVYVEGSGSSFEMAGNSTVISGNTATLSGGGVYVGAGGSFNMTGGAIYGLNAGTLANNAVSGSGSTVFVSPNAAGSNVGSTNNTIVVKVIQQ